MIPLALQSGEVASDRSALKAMAEACPVDPSFALVEYHGDWFLRTSDGIVFSVRRDSSFPNFKAINEAYAKFVAAATPDVVRELIRQLELREDGPLCWTCGDQGHVHRADGDYLGVCDQCNVYELSCVKHDLAQARQVIAEHVEPVSVNTMQRREQWLQNIADAIKFGLPSQLRERLQYTTKQIQASMRYGGTKRLRDELERVKQALADPEAVFTNMKAGKIAKPSIRSMVDLYGEVVNGDEAQLLEIAKLRAQVERQDEEYDKAWRHDLNDKNNVQVLAAEVTRLTAEVELLTAERDARVRQVRNAINEAEELRPDAERYQWLCDGNGYFLEERGLCGHGNEKADADAAIDEKRKELQS